MAQDSNGELLGSNDQAVALGPGTVESVVHLAPAPLARFAASYTVGAVTAGEPDEPDRLFLKLRNIKGNQGACIFDVSVSIPGEAWAPALVGSLALFGLVSASSSKSRHGGAGLTKTIEVTETLDPFMPELKKAGKLTVSITPRGRLGPNDHVTVAKIGLYRLPGT
jgi:tyrosinase